MKKKSVIILSILVLMAALIWFNCNLDQEKKESIKLIDMQTAIDECGYTFTIGDTGIGDYRLLCGINPAMNTNEFDILDTTDLVKASTLPGSYIGATTAVKNQGNCGSCWAFATTGLFEHVVKFFLGATEDFSEQQLVSCNSYNYGCDGGYLCPQFYTGGAMRESCFPYRASEVSCNTSCTKYYRVNSYASVSNNVDSIKQAIYTYGSVASLVYVDDYWAAYTGGTFNRNASSQWPNHAIMLVGWDDSRGAWRLKNSWSTSWGESGYMWMSYGVQRVGEGTMVITSVSN
ncbi:MAG: hypothetical protein JXB50_06685 [Spirochaetes bacterium]|nr:hypothetical protein [Spirochaetota bacterium]